MNMGIDNARDNQIPLSIDSLPSFREGFTAADGDNLALRNRNISLEAPVFGCDQTGANVQVNLFHDLLSSESIYWELSNPYKK
jgi:hypothetical protein